MMKLKGKSELSEANRQKLAILQKNAGEEYGMTDIFTKERVLSYAALILLPPLGLYRLWSQNSTFRRSEKWVWTMIVAVYLIHLISFIVLN